MRTTNKAVPIVELEETIGPMRVELAAGVVAGLPFTLNHTLEGDIMVCIKSRMFLIESRKVIQEARLIIEEDQEATNE